MKGKKIKIWYDEEGDYLEINLKKSQDTYFNEIKEDFFEILDEKTGEIIGYAIINFTKRKDRCIDLDIPIPKALPASLSRFLPNGQKNQTL